jgi:hypothetical protein
MSEPVAGDRKKLISEMLIGPGNAAPAYTCWYRVDGLVAVNEAQPNGKQLLLFAGPVTVT